MTQLFAFFADVDPANLPPDTSDDTRRLAEANVAVVAALNELRDMATNTKDAHEQADAAKAAIGDLFRNAAWAAFDFAMQLGEGNREEYAEAFAVAVSERTENRLKSTLRGFRRDAKLAFVDYASTLADFTSEQRAKARPDSAAHKLMAKAAKVAKAEAEEAALQADFEAHQRERDELTPKAVAMVAEAEGVEEIEVWRNLNRYQPQIDEAISSLIRTNAVLANFADFKARNWLRQLLAEMLPADLEAEAKFSETVEKVAEKQSNERQSRRAA